MRFRTLVFAGSILVVAAAGMAVGQQKQTSDSEYISQALSAAPAAVAKDAAVVRIDDKGNMETLRSGKNGFTCMIIVKDRMCSDANSMEFFHAMMMHTAPTDKVGMSYMLQGDNGASNTDPYATGKTAINHWIVTGPHIMITGTAAKSLGYTEAKDPDPTKPYMMCAGTPYEHSMVPVAPMK
jgi:hypothetical protein